MKFEAAFFYGIIIVLLSSVVTGSLLEKHVETSLIEDKVCQRLLSVFLINFPVTFSEVCILKTV